MLIDENEDITERTIICKRNNKKIHKGANNRFVNKISGKWFFHSDEINQNPTVVSGNRSYANTNKYGRKVIVFGDSPLDVLTENYLVISYQN